VGTLERVKQSDLVWSSILLARHRFILWLVTKDRRLTKERMNKLHIPVDDTTCCMCDDNKVES